ncbi:unnamed protein product [Arabidopsis halleri]
MGGTRIIGVFLSRLLAKMDMVVIFAGYIVHKGTL